MNLRTLIIRRALDCMASGEVFPTIEDMAAEYALHACTVSAAIAKLTRAGVLKFRRIGAAGGRRYVRDIRLPYADRELLDAS